MRYLLYVIILAGIFSDTHAQSVLIPQDSTEFTPFHGPKVGLVLSGGGAKGIMHIALIRAMEEVNMPIDFIGGTSMGAIVGGLYAIGYTADQLEKIVLDANWNRLLSDAVSRRHIPIEEKTWDSMYMISLPIINGRISLPTGLVSGQEIHKLLTRLTFPVHGITDFNEFPIPFVAIATDLENGQPIVMRSGHLADVLRSSMAIPSVFSPHEINHKIAIDGGVARNFPVEDVLDMGADYVIGINVSDIGQRADTLTNIISILDRTVSYRIIQTTLDQSRLVDHLIVPDIGDFNMVSFDAIPEIIKISKEAVHLYKPRLKLIADSLNALRSTKQVRATIPSRDHVFITEIQLHNQKLTQERVILSELKITPQSTVTPAEIEEGIDRIYSLQFFHTVRYRVEPVQNGSILHITVKEKLNDEIKIGLRYDNRDKSSLLFNATFRNTYKPTSTLRLNIRLGEETSYDTQFFYYVGFQPKLGVSLRANYSTYKDDLYHTSGGLIASTQTESIFGEFWVGPVVSSRLIMGIGLKEELYQLTRSIGFVDPTTDWINNHSLKAFLWIDTKNDGVFPTNGQVFRADYTKSLRWFGKPVSFTQYSLRWENYIPINGRVTGLLNIQSNINQGDTPVHLRNYLGGHDRFPGYHRNEIYGEWLNSIQLGAQMELIKNRYVSPSVYLGQSSTVGNLDPEIYPIIYSWGVVGSAKTFVGPIKIGLSGSRRHKLLYDIRVGFEF
jgi:NTE family protein